MSTKKAVRVIKKGERRSQEDVTHRPTVTRDAAREMVQTVSNWVNELQQKRRSEAANAIKNLLSDTPRPSEA